MKEIIQEHIQLSDTAYELLKTIAVAKEAKKGDVLFRPDHVLTKLLFVEKGLLRGYRIVDGKEYTHHFYFSDWFATDFESFLTQQPSQLYMEAMTSCVYCEFEKNHLEALYKEHHELERLGRIIAEKAYLATVTKLADMQLLTLKEKYERLIQRDPQLFQKVPQKYIASYLGVSEQSLSRIKNG